MCLRTSLHEKAPKSLNVVGSSAVRDFSIVEGNSYLPSIGLPAVVDKRILQISVMPIVPGGISGEVIVLIKPILQRP